jgi:hypothetical protein
LTTNNKLSHPTSKLQLTLPLLLSTLFTVFIPGLSGLALAVMALQLIRVAAQKLKPRQLPDLGRKGLMVRRRAHPMMFCSVRH